MIFQRALKRELASTAGAVFTTLFTIMITLMVIKILGQAAASRVGSQDVVELIGFEAIKLMPVILILTGFVSTLMVISRSYRDSEMVVWFASGLSLSRWVKPVLGFAAPLIALTALLSFFATPWAQRQSIEFRERFEKREDISRVSPGRFQESASSNRVFFVEGISGDATRVKNVFVNTELPDGRLSVVVAREGTIDVNPKKEKFLVMEKGRRYDGMPERLDFELTEFERYSVLVSRQSAAGASELSAASLPTIDLISTPSALNRGELLWRIALPAMAFFLMLLAIPLSFVNTRGGRSGNLLVALLLFVVYSNMVSVFQATVAQQRLPFWLGWWPIHMIAAVTIGFFFLWRMKMNSPWHPLTLLSSLRNGRIARSEEKAA